MTDDMTQSYDPRPAGVPPPGTPPATGPVPESHSVSSAS